MKVMVVGKGAREHALAWKISQSPMVKKVFAFPGNAGISEVATIPVIEDDSVEALSNFALNEKIDLTVVGPEDYLANGISDVFESKGLKIFGVNKAAATLESSKAFAKEVMESAGIPTAFFSTVTDIKSGDDILKSSTYPIVLKADGLAAGKGVIICNDYKTAKRELSEMLAGKFKDAGTKVVIEQFLKGEELSLLLFTDGTHTKRLLFSQDHKALLEEDKGPNTGGMGAYTPVSFADDNLYEKVDSLVTEPLLAELKKRGIDYRGVLYIGLMIVDGLPYVLEYNVRFGDPETEPLMFMLESDIIPYFLGCIEKTLNKLPEMKWKNGYGATVVMASEGYPGSYSKGFQIDGLDSIEKGCSVFHAGTCLDHNGRIVTDGGRVLMVTGSGSTIKEALEKTYKSVRNISFKGACFRSDIGYRELKREEK